MFGIVYNSRLNVGVATFETQEAIQKRCRAFATAAGFQVRVASNSTKEGRMYNNAKYTCKQLNGQQSLGVSSASGGTVGPCPFYINVAGKTDENEISTWKTTKACLIHNHIKRTGYSARSVAESQQSATVRLRDRTRTVEELATLVETNLLPAYNGDIDAMSAQKINAFLKKYKDDSTAMTASTIRQILRQKLEGVMIESYQKVGPGVMIESYQKLGAYSWPFDPWTLCGSG